MSASSRRRRCSRDRHDRDPRAQRRARHATRLDLTAVHLKAQHLRRRRRATVVSGTAVLLGVAIAWAGFHGVGTNSDPAQDRGARWRTAVNRPECHAFRRSSGARSMHADASHPTDRSRSSTLGPGCALRHLRRPCPRTQRSSRGGGVRPWPGGRLEHRRQHRRTHGELRDRRTRPPSSRATSTAGRRAAPGGTQPTAEMGSSTSASSMPTNFVLWSRRLTVGTPRFPADSRKSAQPGASSDRSRHAWTTPG